ncbi:MAG: PilW family protein [Gammaproteobacteria bacterium]|nr:PilW family protein [Gammaproteobacteria bacterium]
MRPNRRRQCGFTLLELLLAAALGALTTAALAQLFVSNARASVLQTGQARLQESARLALHFLADSARSAGYYGCGRGLLADGLGGTWRGDLAQDIATPVAGADDVGGGDDVSAWELGDRELKPGTDVVLFRRIEGRGHDLAQPFDADGELIIASTFVPASGQLAVLSACGQLGVLGIESIARRGGRVTLAASVDIDALAPTGFAYGDPAGPAATVLAPVASETYFIARGRFVNSRGEPSWSLWRKAGRADEVVSGVDDLQVLFGIDTTPDDGDVAPGRYVTADRIGAAIVRSVSIRVTVSSIDAFDEGDQPLEQTISQTVALRNPWTPL